MERQVWILTAFATASSLGASMVLPYIPLYGGEIGMPISLIGFLIAIYYGVQLAARIPVGSFSDIAGYPGVVLVGGASLVAASVFYLSSLAVWPVLFAAQLFFGLGVSITWVTIPAYMTQFEDSLPLYTFSVGLGWLVGPPLGGFVRDTLGMYWLFLALLICSIALGGLALLFSRESSEISPTSFLGLDYRSGSRESLLSPSLSSLVSSSVQSFTDAFRLLKENIEVLMAALFSFVMFMTFAIGISIIPLYFSGIGLTALLIGTLQSVRTGTASLIRLFSGKFMQRVEKETLLTLSILLVGLTILLMSQTTSMPLLIILCVLWGLGGGFYLPVVFGLVADGTKKEERGVAMGLRGTMGTAGSALGVLIFMNLAESITIRSSLGVVGVTVMISAFFIWIFGKSRKGGIER